MKRLSYIRKEYPITDIAYMAGIIDGEGSIYIGNFSSNQRTGTPYYQTNIEVTNTSEDLIKWLQNTWNGCSSKYTRKQLPHNSRKDVYRWIAHGELVTHICELIYPYSQCKKREIEIMLKMRETYKQTGMKKGEGACPSIPQNILDIRLSLFNELRSLHCRNYLPKDS
jgi:hypothetical protein